MCEDSVRSRMFKLKEAVLPEERDRVSQMWVRYNKNVIDTHNLSSFHNHPEGIMTTFSQLRKMSLGEK